MSTRLGARTCPPSYSAERAGGWRTFATLRYAQDDIRAATGSGNEHAPLSHRLISLRLKKSRLPAQDFHLFLLAVAVALPVAVVLHVFVILSVAVVHAVAVALFSGGGLHLAVLPHESLLDRRRMAGGLFFEVGVGEDLVLVVA